MTLMGDFDFDGLVKVDRLMAQILCGSYFALAGVVCMNLYIALLSDTFARVYAQAQANAVMQLAQFVILLESKLGKEKRLKFAHYIQDECSPEVYFLLVKLIRDNNKEAMTHFSNISSKFTIKSLGQRLWCFFTALLLFEQVFVDRVMSQFCCKSAIKAPGQLYWRYLTIFLTVKIIVSHCYCGCC